MGGTASGPVTGVANDGFLQLTFGSAVCGGGLSSYLCGGVLFDDFDQGVTVNGFTFDCDLRIGNGSPIQPTDSASTMFAIPIPYYKLWQPGILFRR